MHRWNSAAALAAALVMAQVLPAALKKPITAVTTHLTIDGVACGAVTSWQGGDMRLQIMKTQVGTDQFSTNVARSVICAPLSFDITFPAQKPVMDMIHDLCAGNDTRRTLVLMDIPAGTNTPAQALEVSGAFLTEVRFPAFALAVREGITVTLVVQGQVSRTLANAPAPAPGEVLRRPVVGSMQLEIPGVDTDGLMRLEPFTLSRDIRTTSAATNPPSTLVHPGLPLVPNLIGTLALENAEGVRAWRDDAVTTGSTTPRDGTLTLFDPTAAPIVVFHFKRLGMVGVGVVPQKPAGLRRMSVELSCEHILITVPPPPAATPVPRRVGVEYRRDREGGQPPRQALRASARSRAAASMPR